MNRWLLIVVMCTITPSALANPDVNRGKNAFWAGDFKASALAYRQAIKAYGDTPDLWFNLGTAEANAGRLGYAVHGFEQTLALAPGDAPAGHNLRQVRGRIIDLALAKSKTRQLVLPGDDDVGTGLLNSLEPSTLHGVFAISWCLLFCLIWGGRRATVPSRRTAATFAALLVGLTAFGAGGLLISRTYVVENVAFGVVVSEVSKTHRGPGQQYPRQPDVSAGVKVKLGGTDRGWRQVTLPNGLGVWMPSPDVLRIRRN